MKSRTMLIFRKEIREMARDKRVLMSTIIGPIFLIVLMLMLLGYVQTTITRPKVQEIHVVAGTGDNPILFAMELNPALHIVPIKSVEQGKQMIKEGTAKLVLQFPNDVGKSLENHQQVSITAIRDLDEPMAGLPMMAVERLVRKYNSDYLTQVLINNRLSPQLAESIQLNEAPIRTSEGVGGSMVVTLIPYLIVIWAFYGGFSIVTDMVTGEKEKSTLETLLISPASRTQIAMGKFLALCCTCITGSLTSLISVIIVGVSGLETTKTLFAGGVTVSLTTVVALFLALVPLVAMFAGLLLSISALARNIREAQTYLTLVSFVVLMPAIFSQFIGYTDYAKAAWVSYVPILNSATCIKDALMNRVDPMSLLVTSILSLILAGVSIGFAVKLFNREQILTRV